MGSCAHSRPGVCSEAHHTPRMPGSAPGTQDPVKGIVKGSRSAEDSLGSFKTYDAQEEDGMAWDGIFQNRKHCMKSTRQNN